MIQDWHDRIRWFPCITKLEVVYSHHISALDLGDDQEECVIDRNFDVISQLEGTKIREIVVWHGVEALGISPGFQVLAFHLAKSDIPQKQCQQVDGQTWVQWGTCW
jgi:hypothetical protein